MIYALPALAAIIVKAAMLWWSRKLILETWPFFAFLFFLAVHNCFEIAFYVEPSPAFKTAMMYGYYVAAVVALGFGVVFGVGLWRPELAGKTAVWTTACSGLIAVLILGTDYVVAGFEPLNFSYTRVPGPAYVIFPIWAVGCLAAMVTAIVMSIRYAGSNYVKARNSLILAGFMPFVLVTGIVPLLMIMGFHINAAMVVPITTTIFLLIVLHALTHDAIFDVRALVIGTEQFRRFKKLMAHVAFVHRTPQSNNPNDLLHNLELEIYQQALKAAGGNKTHAAQRLGVHPNTLRYRLKKLNLA
jgi:hypothetical protein